ncbi:MAG: hypothetical protein ACTSXW_01570 [Candidatus Baldrarchaeia archaeon]|mgnify:CR=1 FL=1
MSRYSRGRRIEYLVRDILLKAGWYVWRLAASKPFDLIAIRNGEILIIECKKGSVLTKIERTKLLEIAKNGGATPILAKYENNIVHFYKILSEDKLEEIEIKYFKGNT